MERSVNDPTMRIGLFHPTAPSVHGASRVVNDLNPNVLDLAAHARLELVKIHTLTKGG